MSRSVGLVLLGVSVAFTAQTALAAEHTITQKNKEFSQAELKVKVGDKITFKNDDAIAHNVFSKSAGNDFNLKIQKPGESGTTTLNAEGEVEIRCAIHPKMVVKVKVEK